MEGKVEDEIERTALNKRRLFLSDGVDSNIAKYIIRRLWHLDTISNDPILFVINTPGGAIDAGFAIWDQCNMVTAPVYTLVTGLAASMGSVLCLLAKKGKRFATPHSRFMVHQPLISGVIQGQATDLDIQAKEIIKNRELLVELYEKNTGKSKEEIERAIDRDTWMNAEEAKKFGLIDRVVSSYDEIS